MRVKDPNIGDFPQHDVLTVYDDGLWHLQIRRDNNGDGSCGQ